MHDDMSTFDQDNDHSMAGDDSVMHLEPEPGHPEGEDAEHPAEPATYPIPPKEKLTEFVSLSMEEIAEKGKLMARKLLEVEGLKNERADLNGEIKECEEEITKLRNAINAGQVEVPVVQQDLLRQPVGAQAAARAFEEMAADAKAAAGQEPAGDPEAEARLNAMAAKIQAENGIDAPGPGFLNDIENHKARSAAKRKGKK
jgi:chromosome segregation ATPase